MAGKQLPNSGYTIASAPQPATLGGVRIPTITGIIRRRILANYRVDPEVAASIIPGNFRPKLHNGSAVAGICLIRLEEVRPKGLPRLIGISSENSAHRIAVEWGEGNEVKQGVFIPRRDTDSRLNSWTGGRIFPGVHRLSTFTVEDAGDEISIRISASDHATPLVEIRATISDSLPETSIFPSLESSSAFFEGGCIGYSARPDSPILDGLRLDAEKWSVAPLEVRHIRSAYFDDLAIFPSDSIRFDHALLMRDIPHEWHAEPEMTAGQNGGERLT
jgi:hypothetical protein